ncbi:MAG TPA: ribosome biogenesis GTPase Der [Candidatus Babeliales bacterium]|nr:ribosome biogenesis GTPase Der [Candidatus Babeliales bacterium]
MSSLPQVVIVGRTNVGKSTLFNRLSTDVKSMTLDYEGVTRDFVRDTVCWKDTCFELIDSGGISIHKVHDPLGERVRQLGFDLIEKADLLLFVVDGKAGLTEDDRQLIQVVRRKGNKVLLAINKMDSNQAQEMLYEFVQLGFDEQFPISAQHGTGIAELLDAILAALPKHAKIKEEEPRYSVVLLGKPNVGKSSLMNLLLEQERSIVFDQPGTTREAITEPIKFYQETIAMTDTPGIRKKRSIDESLEEMMVKSSFRAVKNASIILLLIDSPQGHMSDQELKLAFYCFQEGKAIILLFNKDDLMTDFNRKDLAFDLERYDYFIKKIPSLTISCKTGKNIGKILPLVKKVWERNTQKLNDLELTQVFKAALERTPLYYQSKLLMLYRAEQVRNAPITVLLYVNEPKWFGQSQVSFFENVMREHFDLVGVPVLFILRKRN